MNPFAVLKRPLLSEKSMKNQDEGGRYSFEVDLLASKHDIANAVTKVFGVKVESVNTIVARTKVKRKGMHVTAAKKFKKAMIKVADGQKIELFDNH